MDTVMVFAVYDSKAEAYMSPFFMPTVAMAIRAFRDSARDGNSNIGKHPEDFSLWRLGGFRDSDGALIPEKPVKLAEAKEENHGGKVSVVS